MFSQFGNPFGLQPLLGVFSEHFRCYSAAFLPGNERENVNYGSKIILPQSALAKLTSLHIEYPMLFHLTNEDNGKDTHAGVLEFVAEEGRAYVPRWMMQSLLLNEGDIISIKSVTLPLGKFVKIQPQSVDFLDIYDPKAVLENAFRSFSTLTQGDIITISYNNKQYDILIMEVKPARAVSIIETDLEVDFAPPLGYVEPDYKAKAGQGAGGSSNSKKTAHIHPGHASIRDDILSHVKEQQAQQPKTGWANLGSGQRLSGKAPDAPSANMSAQGKGKAAEEPVDAMDSKAPLRLPIGKLFFGFNTPLYEREDADGKSAKDKGKGKADGDPFAGVGGPGQTLRAAKKAAARGASGSLNGSNDL
ncbi:ubiquitin fusion degradation protein [Sorochytrium milnesiophthora]